MIIISEYRNIIQEIEIMEWLHEDLLNQLERNRSYCWGNSVPLPKALSQYDNIIERLQSIEYAIDEAKTLKGKIEEAIKNLQGIEYIVAFGREIEGKDLQTIAAENGYTYDYIRKISSRSKRHNKGTAQLQNV